MTGTVERAAAWMYGGIWGVLTRWFRVPQDPPTLPVLPGEQLQSFRPSEGFLRYLKLRFWIALTVVDGLILVGWLLFLAIQPGLAIVLAPVPLALAIVPDVSAYLAIHLKFDTTWYVLSQRSLRIRSGIWTINEATITFENIQNVTVESGPVERFFGIGNVIVETAGGGSGGESGHGKEGGNLHRGKIAGISNADEVRLLILNRLSLSRATGLGDETDSSASSWSSEHLAVLREIRNALSTSP